MDNQTFVLYKENDKWMVESKNKGLEKSEHSSQMNAIRAVLRRHPRRKKFYIEFPAPIVEVNNAK